jgi:hypothetical protein
MFQLTGVAFINLSLGFRLSNRNQTIMQGFAFLYNYQRLCKFNQVLFCFCIALRYLLEMQSFCVSTQVLFRNDDAERRNHVQLLKVLHS